MSLLPKLTQHPQLLQTGNAVFKVQKLHTFIFIYFPLSSHWPQGGQACLSKWWTSPWYESATYKHRIDGNSIFVFLLCSWCVQIPVCLTIGAYSKWLDAASSGLSILPSVIEILMSGMGTSEDSAAAAALAFRHICDGTLTLSLSEYFPFFVIFSRTKKVWKKKKRRKNKKLAFETPDAPKIAECLLVWY